MGDPGPTKGTDLGVFNGPHSTMQEEPLSSATTAFNPIVQSIKMNFNHLIP